MFEIQASLTYRGGTGIQAILKQFLDDGAQIYNDLTWLDPMHLKEG